MASKIKVDQIVGSTGNTVVFPAGQTVTITDGLTVAGGGTGLASFTAGDVLYATGSTTLAKLAKGTAEQVLAMNAGATAPDWGSVDLTVLPTITVAKGGTNLSSFAAGDILYATGSTTLAKLAKGTASQTLKMNAGATAPEWATVAASGAGSVRFHARMESAQSIANTTETNIVFDTEVIDVGSGYNTSSGYWTVPSGEGGTYMIYYSHHFGTGAGNAYQSRIYKSTDTGSTWSKVHHQWDYDGNGYNVNHNTYLIVLSAADVLKTTLYHGQSSTQSMYAEADVDKTFFGGWKLV